MRNGYLIIDRDGGGQGMREQMRNEMRRNYGYRYNHGGGDQYEAGYREGYRHAVEDMQNDDDEERYRRERDSRGRYM